MGQAEDRVIWLLAEREGMILITKDEDFVPFGWEDRNCTPGGMGAPRELQEPCAPRGIRKEYGADRGTAQGWGENRRGPIGAVWRFWLSWLAEAPLDRGRNEGTTSQGPITATTTNWSGSIDLRVHFRIGSAQLTDSEEGFRLGQITGKERDVETGLEYWRS